MVEEDSVGEEAMAKRLVSSMYKKPMIVRRANDMAARIWAVWPRQWSMTIRKVRVARQKAGAPLLP